MKNNIQSALQIFQEEMKAQGFQEVQTILAQNRVDWTLINQDIGFRAKGHWIFDPIIGIENLRAGFKNLAEETFDEMLNSASEQKFWGCEE